MYKHIVFWKLKEEVNGISKQELITEVKKRLDALLAVIPEIKDFETAINIGDYSASFYDICLIVVFENKETFWSYTKYAEHNAVVAYIQSVQEAEQIVDFEF